jgi:hypothetical protein
MWVYNIYNQTGPLISRPIHTGTVNLIKIHQVMPQLIIYTHVGWDYIIVRNRFCTDVKTTDLYINALSTTCYQDVFALLVPLTS